MPSIASKLAFDEAKLSWELDFFFDHYFGSLRAETLRHAEIDVPDELGRRLITLLDGTRDRAALLRELGRPADELERSLQGLAAIGLLER